MRKFVFLLGMALAAVLMSTSAVCAAQTDSIQYQLVIRDSEGHLVANKHVNMRFSLMSGGQTFYEETMLTTTNKYGNIDVMIGTGNALKGSMKDVPWSTMDISLKVDSDTDGGNNFRELGTVPIAAAPYAMYAATAGSNANNGSPKDGEPLFEVSDRNGQPVFAVYNDGIVVYVDESNPDKAKRSGLIVTGRRATKENGAGNDYFAVTTEGTHIYVDDADASKAKRSGLIVTGRRATKDDANDYLTIDAEGTHIFVDSASDDKAKRSGLIVTGRRATKDGEQAKILTIDANSTQIFIDDTDDSKAKRSGLIVTGRRATKDGESIENDYFTVTADGTQVVVDIPDDNESDTKAKRSGLIVTGRRATKAGSDMFAVNGSLTTVYVDDTDASKAKRSGLIVTGRRATKNDINYVDIDADRTNLNSALMTVTDPRDSVFAMQMRNDRLWFNSDIALDGELRRWLTLQSVDEPYKLEVTTDQTIENSDLVYDIMGDYSSFVVMAELDEEKRCMPYINEQQTMAFDQNGKLTYDIENAYVVVDFDYDLNIHPIKPCDNINIAFAMVNYEYTYSYGPNGWAQIPTVPINYREFNFTIKAETIEPSIEVVAVTKQQEDNDYNWTYFGSATVNGKVCETNDDIITSTDMVTYGSEVTLEANANNGCVFVGWVAYSYLSDIYEGYGEIARYSENPLKIRATRNVYYLAQFKSLEEPLYVNHNNDHSEWCYGDDDSHNGTNGCDDALYSVEKALQILAGYNAPNANLTIDVTNYNEDFTIGSVLNGKAATLTIKNSIFAYNTTGKVTINTTVPVGIESKYSYAEEIDGGFAVGAGASLALQKVNVNSVELNATAKFIMVGAEVTEPIQLADGQTITLYTTGNKAIITPAKYDEDLPILTVPAEFGTDAAALLAAEAENFSVTQGALPQGYSADDGWHWIIGTDGKLALSDMITYEFDDYSLGTNTSNSRYFTKTKDELIEGRKYRFTVANGFTNLSGLCNMLYDGNLSSSYVNYYGGKHFGESILDLSNARSINHSNTNYVNSNLGSYYTTFDNNIITIILPYETSISGQSNLFMNVQDALKEIKLATGNTYSGNGAISNGAFVYTIGSGSTAARYLYCYPSQREGTTYTIPNDVNAIYDAAFYMNANLETIENLGQITQVGGYVFAESKKLKAVDLSGVTKFEVKGNSGKGSESPFLFCNSNIEKVTLPSWQFTIGESWFDGCSKLEEVEFKGTTPPHLTNRYSLASQYSVSNHFNSINSNVVFRVPSGAVRNYIEPTGTGMDNGYAYYEFANTSGNYLFRNGTYYITDGTVTAVGINRAAEAISNVSTNGQTIIIGGSISDSQWQELNTALAGATFPVTLDFSMQSFTSFGTWFKNSQNLSGIVLPQSVTAIDADAFNGCSALALFEVPAGVTTIGAGAFSGCSSLSTVTVAENSNLKKIGERAFQNSGLTEITIPAGVMRIGAGAFSGTNLASVSGFNANDWLEVVNGTNTAINLNGQSVAEYLKNCSNQLVNKETTWDESECYQFHNTITLLPETTTGTNGANSRYVYFGDYPRTHKASDVIVDEDKEKTVGAFTYYLGSDKNYYVKHRVVRNSYYYDDGSNVENTGEYAYFKVEPIKWRVLTTDYNGTGKALLMADNATAGYFDYIESGRAFFYYKKNNNDGNYGNRTIDGETIYPNNYEYSNIRAWLNGYDGSQYDDDLADWTNRGFLQSAFTSSAQNLIVQTVVDNSAEQCFEPDETTNTYFDDYLSGNTTDKVFLLSKREVSNHSYGFDDGMVQYGSRMVAPTDYAKASYISHYSNYNNGSYTYYGCEWWLRTPQATSNTYNNGISAMTVDGIGYIGNAKGVEQSMYAVVPAICVDLSFAGIELTAGAGNPAFENGALTIGKFKVSATGKTVQFSQGNLQYKQNSNFKTYHFADYQYHSIGNYGDKFSADNTSSYNRRDLFLSSRFTSFSDLGIIETNYDDWCELSADEWQFLLSREGKSGVATIDGNNGLILLPDNWTAPEGIVFAAGFVGAEDDYGKNNHYTAAQWAKMEQAGAVFLPAAGSFGWKMNVQNQVLTGYERNVSGLYWSAKNDQGKRSLVWFNKTHAEILTSTELASGDQLNDLAVRLVREVEP